MGTPPRSGFNRARSSALQRNEGGRNSSRNLATRVEPRDDTSLAIGILQGTFCVAGMIGDCGNQILC